MKLVATSLFCTLILATPGHAQAPFAAFDRASEPVLADPHDLTVGPDGRLYVADKDNSRIVVMDAETLEVIETFGDGALPGVRDISFGAAGKAYTAVASAGSVAVYSVGDGAPALDRVLGRFARPEGVLAHSGGRLFVMASASGQLIAIENGEAVATIDGFFGAHDVAEGLDGSLWVADFRRRRLVQLSPDLEVLNILDDAKFGFAGPRYLDVDDFGRLVVSDRGANRVLLIDPLSREILGVLGDGAPGIGPNKFNDPEGVAAHGNAYYFSDADNARVVRYVVVIN